jgi:hypothetical protein
MSEAILSVVAVTVVLIAAVLLVLSGPRRPGPVPDGSPSAASTRTGRDESESVAPVPDADLWQWALVSDLSAARGLLDWAEGQGFEVRELTVLGNSMFLIRWRRRA